MPNPVEIIDDPSGGSAIGIGATDYRGLIECFGANQVTWHLVASDADPMASITVQVSNDGTNYQDAAAANCMQKFGASTQALNVGQVVVAVPSDAAMKYIPWKWIRLKMVGGAAETAGVEVTPIAIYSGEATR